MEFKIFSDVVDALEKIAKAVIELKNIPRNKRNQYREAVAKSYQLLNSATNLIILRLGDILLLDSQTRFVSELRKLDNDQGWMTIERDVRLCANLRDVHPDMDGLLSRIIHFRGRDWANARELVDRLLEREGTLAGYISTRLAALARMATKTRTSMAQYRKARAAVERVRDTVKRERMRLIRSEVSFLDALGRKAGV